MQEHVNKLKTQLNRIEDLEKEVTYSPKYKIWDRVTTKILQSCVEEDMLKIFTQIAVISSYASSRDASRLYLKHLQKKRDALESLIDYIEGEGGI